MSNELGRKPRSMEQADRNGEMERLLVEGELITGSDGKQTRVFPHGCEIAERLGVSNAWVSKFANKHRCFQRRAEYQAKVQAKVQQKLVRQEAKRIAFDTERSVSLCDKVLARYEDMLDERGVGNFTVADMNTVIRLRRYLQGDADSRQEVTNAITLSSLQTAHREMLRQVHDVSPEECGIEPDDAGLISALKPQVFSIVQGGAERKINQLNQPAEAKANVRECTKPDIEVDLHRLN